MESVGTGVAGDRGFYVLGVEAVGGQDEQDVRAWVLLWVGDFTGEVLGTGLLVSSGWVPGGLLRFYLCDDKQA